MSPLVCFYFQVHQPYRLRDLRITEIGKGTAMNYFDHDKNRAVFRKVAEKCYLPANRLMLALLEQYPDLAIAYSLSGVFLDQCEEYGQDVLDSFRALAATGRVEFLAETYYHSLSSIRDTEEFCEQVTLHIRKIEDLFGVTPRVFRNTELIYSNELAQTARLMGFSGILAEGTDHLLQGRSANMPYTPPRFRLPRQKESIIARHRPLAERSDEITVLLKNYRLSDDVAFRFSDKSWVGFPLNAETFTDWMLGGSGHSVNLFMDYETFGEHQWEDTGIFEFLRTLPRVWKERGIRCSTPSQVIEAWKNADAPVYDVHSLISWADTERDLSAWQGNQIQTAALKAIYDLGPLVKATGNPDLIRTWRKLQTSDHFYYMCTKYWNDGDVHKYFSPYDSPYEAYRRYSHAVCDLKSRVEPKPVTRNQKPKTHKGRKHSPTP
ncbi:MAG: glycoside hydrolase family 57 protein [Candidatus Peribacteraceae bacterium]|nr:glycoside hydrolase family 57 protein [Candidatus Peribacteraceae bacterium]